MQVLSPRIIWADQLCVFQPILYTVRVAVENEQSLFRGSAKWEAADRWYTDFVILQIFYCCALDFLKYTYS